MDLIKVKSKHFDNTLVAGCNKTHHSCNSVLSNKTWVQQNPPSTPQVCLIVFLYVCMFRCVFTLVYSYKYIAIKRGWNVIIDSRREVDTADSLSDHCWLNCLPSSSKFPVQDNSTVISKIFHFCSIFEYLCSATDWMHINILYYHKAVRCCSLSSKLVHNEQWTGFSWEFCVVSQ